MVCPVYVKNYSAPTVKAKEIMRYVGVREESLQINSLIKECLNELGDKLCYKVCFSEYPIEVNGDNVDLTFTTTTSKDLAKTLKGCEKVIVFCATVGIGVDRLIAKYNALSPTKALMFQAIGAERIESLCNLFASEINKKYKLTKPRFSAGYGDLSLQLQTEIFNALNCNKNVGVSLNQSLLMSPSKSVTAIIGVSGDLELADND